MMSTEFITIKEAKSVKKGSFVGVVIKQGDLKSGTKDNRDWTKKTYTIQDATDEVILTTWGDEISMLKVGNKYEFTNPWWKEYEGKITLALGKYATLKLIGTDEINNKPQQSTMEESAPESRGQVGEPLPEAPQALKDFILIENMRLAQIEKGIIDEMKKESPTVEINGAKVGLRVKEIYRSWKKEVE